MFGKILDVLDRLLKLADKVLYAVKLKKTEDALEKAKAESIETKSQEPLEKLFGDSGNPTQHKYDSLQHRQAKDRREVPPK